jgi:hypothetical protein
MNSIKRNQPLKKRAGLEMKTACVIPFTVAVCTTILAAAYTSSLTGNPVLKASLAHPANVIRLLYCIEWCVLIIPGVGAIIGFFGKSTPTRAQIARDLLFGFSILWPTFVITAWQIQSVPIVGLGGFK